MRDSYNTLICTVGTSLFMPKMMNLVKSLREDTIEDQYKGIAEDYDKQNWIGLGVKLREIDPTDRFCGAEINSISSMRLGGYLEENADLIFLHSDTDDGRNIAKVLTTVYSKVSSAEQIDGLQDNDPKKFRSEGLRNLARRTCAVLHMNRHRRCAINATGGFKAQIAIAVVLGQAMSVPVFYKHERFDRDAIIEIPPMPVSLSFEHWLRLSPMLFELADPKNTAKLSEYQDLLGNMEEVESLIERVSIEGEEYVELSPVGQVFHESFSRQLEGLIQPLLPQSVGPNVKKPPKIEQGGVQALPEVLSHMEAITKEVPYVEHCYSFYYNPDLPGRTSFRKSSTGIEGVFSNGTYTVKFGVQTSCVNEAQQLAVVADLNQWLSEKM